MLIRLFYLLRTVITGIKGWLSQLIIALKGWLGQRDPKTFFEGGLFANILSFTTLLVAVLVLVIGGRELIIEFKKRRRHAIFSYYSGLRHYFLRLDILIRNKDKVINPYLYRMSASDRETKLQGRRICDLAEKFLDYLSTKDEQVPPIGKHEGWKKWDKLVERLTRLLDSLIMLGKGSVAFDSLSSKKKKDYIDTLVNEFSDLRTKMECSIIESIAAFYKSIKDKD
ncbi:MAG: hypothetical protein LBB91_03270 [Clostridiales bacterium]|jgi:hypothetical protein|nr:hypothetical protein [Clostridiales bacterium]